MKPQWLSPVIWQCLLAGMVFSAAVPTQDTMVVARSDDVQTTAIPNKPTETSTDEPNVPIKLTEMRVHSEIALRYAHTSVVAHVRNPARRSQQASFRVLLPDTAFISGFVMTLDGKSYKAYVKEKEEAKQIYNEAVSQGFGAAHVTAKARDSNHFTVSVNVEPNTTALFNLTYEELLVRRNGVYNHAINLHPGAVVPNMQVTVHIKESQKITQLRVPEMRTGNEVDATELDAQNPLAVVDRNKNQYEATVTFTPDPEEQKRLIEIYTDKTRQSASQHDRWYRGEEDEEKKQDGVLGQFVVQYDIDRSKTGEILVNDGYFVHFFAPTSLSPLSKHVVFVLDTSGSMMGRKVQQLREAMQVILGKLNKGDYFNIVEFDSFVQVHNLKEADEPAKKQSYSYFENSYGPVQLVAPSPASTENIEKAKTIVSRMEASGGTNINSALDVAIDLIHKGIYTVSSTNQQPASSESPAPTNHTLTEEKKDVNSTEISKSKEDKNLEPIIIFLTDGDPTVGETNTARIISHLTEKNYGEKKASIFSLAFGEDADRNFLRKLSLRNEGFMRHIYEAADAALQLRDFYRQVASPLLADVKFIYPKEQIKEGSVTRNKYRTIYDGAEVIVAGKIVDDTTEITPQVLGFCGVDDGFGRKLYEVTPKVPVSKTKSEYYPLERLWAYLTIKQLLDEKDAADSEKNDENSPEKRALAVALKYEFVTPLTSLVVVKPNSTKAVNAESVDGQNDDQPYQHLISAADIPDRIFGGSSLITPLSANYDLSPLLSSQSSAFGLSAYSVGSQHQLYDAVPLIVGGSSPAFEAEEEELHEPGKQGAPGMPSPPKYFHSSHSHSHRRPAAPGMYGLHNSNHNQYPTTYIVSSTPQATTTASDPLAEYHLEEYSWVQPLLNTDKQSLLLQYSNGTEINFKLSKDDIPKSDGGDVECAKATDGAVGACVYLTRCAAAKHISVDTYRDTQCAVNNEYAGVCCPKDEIDTRTN